MAMDRITRNLLVDFVKSEGLKTLDESDAFERFAAFCVVSREHRETFNVEDLITGGGNDTGVDGLAILVNGSLVTSVEEIDDLLETNGYIEAAFVFVQGKAGANFDAGGIGTFATGVRDFFSETPQLPRNDAIANAVAIQSAIYDKLPMNW
jgi:hypothetical protein